MFICEIKSLSCYFRKHLVNYLSLLCLSLELQLLIIIVVNVETVSPVVAILLLMLSASVLHCTFHSAYIIPGTES